MKPEETEPRPFSDFTAEPNIVLLGDPGAGKSHLFRETAAHEGRFITMRAFFNTPAEMLKGRALFIDGLDEKRAGRGDRDTVDALVVKLFEVGPPKVRISCRFSDWLGDSDLAALTPFFDQDGACVLHLEKLSRDDQVSVLIGQAVGAEDAARFLDDATERGLGEFLDNPQNLIMLWRAVQTGTWPATRTQLFERATELMLQEFNAERARSGGGAYSATELRPVAGAVCAARLISDVEAISLTDQEGSAGIPGYRSLQLVPAEKIQAALGRRVFEASSQPETVDYAHRTTAEFLAAQFLATRIRAGLPFGRVKALIGVDGHPATELRGLHAWLAVHLPERADELIDGDAYGVLTYGDAASLSPSSCVVLIRALARLEQRNPWFRSGNWQANSIGALARPDMIGEFKAILSNPDAGFGIRSVVIDALALGTPLPAMLEDLEMILKRGASPFAERLRALEALLRLGDPGKRAVLSVHGGQLGTSLNDLRLREQIVRKFYGDPCGPQDVIALLDACLQIQDSSTTTVLWGLADHIPLQDLPAILDGAAPPGPSARDDRRTWDVSSFYARALARTWPVGELQPARAMAWLHKRVAFGGGHREGVMRELRTALLNTPERLRTLAKTFFDTVPVDEQRWTGLHRFREAIFFGLDAAQMAAIAVDCFEATPAGSARRSFLYEVAISLCYQMPEAAGAALFDSFFELAGNDPDLLACRASASMATLPANYFTGRRGRSEKVEEVIQSQRLDFDRDVALIRSGQHVGWLKHLAFIYFALYDEVDRASAPRERLAIWLGEERVEAALEGLAATLSRNDIPGFADVLALAQNHQHYDWWFALVAGLNERWSKGKGLAGLTDDFVQAMLAFDITNPVSKHENGTERWVIHPWRAALMETRPELVRNAYLAVVQLRLSQKEQIADGLNELLTESCFESFRQDIVLDLLRQFPNAEPDLLGRLFDVVTTLPGSHSEFLTLADGVLSGTVHVDGPQRDLWLATAYILAPAQHEAELRRRAATHRGILFDLRDRSGVRRRGEPERPLSLPILETVAQMIGSLFPQAAHPVGGWSGDRNPWDASEHFSKLVDTIAAMPSAAATDALRRLEADPGLASYKPNLLHALASQQQRRRDLEYDRPDWPQTVAMLAHGVPATVADLHALCVAHLGELAHRIARANNDMFKQFWNVDSHQKVTVPRPEELCRDHLLSLLRPELQPLGIAVEPEGHMVADKRADVSVAMPARKILCELKRDYHAEVWTAPMGQLERFYAHDPEAKGFGIYLVFWFGDKRPRPIPAPPNGLDTPGSAAEMENMLRANLPEPMRARLEVIVMDVSGEV